MMSMRLPRATKAEAAKKRMFELTEAVIARAQASGQLRADLTHEDLAFLAWPTPASCRRPRRYWPDAWRRHLGLLLRRLPGRAGQHPTGRPADPAPSLPGDALAGLRCGGRSEV